MYRFLPIPEDAFGGRNYRFCILCMPSTLYIYIYITTPLVPRGPKKCTVNVCLLHTCISEQRKNWDIYIYIHKYIYIYYNIIHIHIYSIYPRKTFQSSAGCWGLHYCCWYCKISAQWRCRNPLRPRASFPSWSLALDGMKTVIYHVNMYKEHEENSTKPTWNWKTFHIQSLSNSVLWRPNMKPSWPWKFHKQRPCHVTLGRWQDPPTMKR